MTVTCSTTRKRDVEVVLDDDEAHVRGQRREQRHQLAALAGRQAGGGLVEQDQPRRAGQRHADLELALLAVRQARHQALRPRTAGARARAARRSRAREGCAARGRRKLEAAARDAAHGKEKIVADREVAEQQRRLVGAPQSHADAVVGRHAR